MTSTADSGSGARRAGRAALRTLRRSARTVRKSLRRSSDQLTGRTIVPEPRFLGSIEYARRYGGRWHRAYSAAPSVRRPPVQYGPIHADFEAKLDPRIPELGVLELDRGLVLGRHGWVISPEHHWLADHAWAGTHTEELLKRLPAEPLRVERVAGTCLSLTSDSSYFNYAHFLLDALPRLHLFEKAGFSLDAVDHIYCPVPTRSARRMLDRIGITGDRLIVPAYRVAIQPDILLATTYPGTRHNYQPWLADYLRNLVTPETVTPRRRLYVRRTEFRRLVNEDELLPLLLAEGFEVYDPLEHESPPHDFAEASVIVGVHGANLADVIFCRPGASVLELVPLDHQEPYYYTAADAAGLRYGYLIAEAVLNTARGPNQSDVRVDVPSFAAALKASLASSR